MATCGHETGLKHGRPSPGQAFHGKVVCIRSCTECCPERQVPGCTRRGSLLSVDVTGPIQRAP